ncbi:fumarylacetoacetate hydrolase domain-containing protein 2 [Arthrobacter sp. Hiyo1]|nr:fumarylacetoacetate hydrolase domain-containing protein 2 [Arthrobacter sp. Hiyo1]
MKLATLRTAGGGTTAALATGANSYLALPVTDVGALLAQPQWRTIVEKAVAAGGNAIADPDFAPLLPRAGKVICCGLNYGDHIQEMGRDLPEYPTLFAKYADTLTGPADTIHIHGSSRVDWEAELAVVVGSELFGADEDEARKLLPDTQSPTTSPCGIGRTARCSGSRARRSTERHRWGQSC